MKTRIVGLAMAFCFASVLHAKSLDETIAFCDDCHGKGGVSKESDVPTIAGFSSVAITDILNAYKSDSRSGKTDDLFVDASNGLVAADWLAR